MKSTRILAIAVALTVVASFAQAEVLLTFDTDVEGYGGTVAWDATRQAIQEVVPNGGWTMGGGGGPNIDLNAQGYGADISNMVATGNARLSLDVWVDGSASFLPDTGGGAWFQLHMAGNSDGAAGWTQLQLADGWHNEGDPAIQSFPVDVSAAEVGWEPGDNWYQIHHGSNSDGAQIVAYYVDNVRIYVIPEPGTLALVGLGVLGLAVARRRR